MTQTHEAPTTFEQQPGLHPSQLALNGIERVIAEAQADMEQAELLAVHKPENGDVAADAELQIMESEDRLGGLYRDRLRVEDGEVSVIATYAQAEQARMLAELDERQ